MAIDQIESGAERGFALVVCLLAVVLMAALGVGLVMATTTEAMIAANFRSALEARTAASAIVERAFVDLARMIDWTPALNGGVRSAFYDGSPGVRPLSDGSEIDLRRIINMLNCNRSGSCADAEMDASTAERPWGTNNPRWQLFASGPLAALTGGAGISRCYAVALVADDQLENDGDPVRDGLDRSNPGTAILRLRGEAFCGRSTRRGVEATLVRDPLGTRLISWRETDRLDRP